jgi:hypothetical protein
VRRVGAALGVGGGDEEGVGSGDERRLIAVEPRARAVGGAAGVGVERLVRDAALDVLRAVAERLLDRDDDAVGG